MSLPRILFPIALGLVLFLSGCATRYQVRLDALSARDSRLAAAGQTYTLVDRSPGSEDNELFFGEVARHLHPVLEKAGYEPAPEGGTADLRIAVKAYLSEPLVETRSFSEPIYYDYPGRSYLIRIPVVDKDGKFMHYSYSRYWSPPRTRIAGYVDRDRQMTVYDKILKLSARETGPDGGTGDEVWSLSVALRSESTDYRAALPIMLVAAEPYIGRRTEGEETVVIREDSPELEAYRNRIGNAR